MKHVAYSIGHSNRTFEAFLELLKENQIEVLADIRTIPKSRANPQFNLDSLEKTIPEHGLQYVHIEKLGGLRGKKKDGPSNNMIWENMSFRNYADYAETEGFREGFAELTAIAEKHPTAYMCSEAVWWRCHRRIVTDYLLASGWDIFHILAPGKVTPATIDAKALVNGPLSITYPAPQTELNV